MTKRWPYGLSDEGIRISASHPQSLWGFDDMVILRELYPNYSVSPRDLKQAFPHFTMRQIASKASMMGLTRVNHDEKIQWCYKCKVKQPYSEDATFCVKCGKRLRIKTRSNILRRKRTDDLPESTARTAAEIEAGES